MAIAKEIAFCREACGKAPTRESFTERSEKTRLRHSTAEAVSCQLQQRGGTPRLLGSFCRLQQCGGTPRLLGSFLPIALKKAWAARKAKATEKRAEANGGDDDRSDWSAEEWNAWWSQQNKREPLARATVSPTVLRGRALRFLAGCPAGARDA
jgi:hypothetical protein